MPIDTTPITPTTLLEAINTLLVSVRIARINSLAQVDANEDAAQAKQAIDAVSREVQAEGWEFNTEADATLLHDPDTGHVTIPFNALRVTTNRFSGGTRLVVRGRKLYDTTRRTYSIGAPAKVDLVLALEFSELPPAAKTYVVAVAARRFGIPKMPEGSTFRFTEEMVREARTGMEQEDDLVSDTTLDQTSPHFARMGRR